MTVSSAAAADPSSTVWGLGPAQLAKAIKTLNTRHCRHSDQGEHSYQYLPGGPSRRGKLYSNLIVVTGPPPKTPHRPTRPHRSQINNRWIIRRPCASRVLRPPCTSNPRRAGDVPAHRRLPRRWRADLHPWQPQGRLPVLRRFGVPALGAGGLKPVPPALLQSWRCARSASSSPFTTCTHTLTHTHTHQPPPVPTPCA